ncbi:MAG: hypothetical protein AAFP80_02585 [Pseudomonadota bacterium]
MKKVAILVIAAVNQPVYISYIRNYWTSVINLTRSIDHIDVFLLLENSMPRREFQYLSENVIIDPRSDFDELLPEEFQKPRSGLPSILSKTIHALEMLKDDYDLFFRTNLSSLIKISAFDRFVQSKDEFIYSGAWVWADCLRDNLLHHNNVGPGKSIADLSELDAFEGNTFVSGAGYFINAAEALSLVERKDHIRYDLADDVSVGLMFSRHELLHGFSDIAWPEQPAQEVANMIRDSRACHIRLQHFSPLLAENVWMLIKDDSAWQ